MLIYKTAWVLMAVLAVSVIGAPTVSAVASSPAPDAGLALQVSPSPIVVTTKPGEQKTVEFKIYNAGVTTENLKVGLQAFTIDRNNSKVTLAPNKTVEAASWVDFSNPVFSIKPGERFSEKLNINTPTTAGFSYNFAIVVSRQTPPKAVTGQSAIQGSIAIFALLDINRPGAVRKLTIANISTDHHVYEYLPAKLTLQLRNDGNTLLLPDGTAYIQRKIDSPKPITTLGINPGSLYLLPGIQRAYEVSWTDGFPAYVTTLDAANASPAPHLTWNWRNSHFRIGKYFARVVVIYDDGHRTVPVEATTSFWVFPWRLLIGLLLAVVVLLIGLGAIGWLVYRTIKHGRIKYRA